MSRISTCLVTLFTLALVIGILSMPAHAAIIVGFDYGTTTSNVETDFVRVSDSDAVTTDPITGISIVADTSASTRERGSTPPDPLRDLVYDLHFVGNSNPIVFTIAGLTPNTTYDIIGYSYDVESGNNGKIIRWTTNGGFVDHTTNSSDPSSAAFNLAPMTTDALGVGTITGDHIGGSGGAVILWNGFAIIPEPASLMLVGIGSMLLLGRKRR